MLRVLLGLASMRLAGSAPALSLDTLLNASDQAACLELRCLMQRATIPGGST